MSFSPEALDAQLAAQLPRASGGKLCVAFSGGVDSSCLLQALSRLRRFHADWQIRAIHVDHQLAPASGDWAEQNRSVAQALEVPLSVVRVAIDRNDPHGLESAARAARYAEFRRELSHGEVLLTAHHANDQAETLLLTLLRGSGVQGAASMPAIKPFGRGWHMRPFLSFTRDELAAWAREQGLISIDDPANAHLRHDRNYLRHQVIPRLLDRWPGALQSLGRSVAHFGEALAVLEEVAVADLRLCAVDRCLDLKVLLALTPERRRNLLRYWLRLRGLPLPSTRKLAGLELDLLRADSERMPLVAWAGAEVHWYRGLLYADASQELSAGSREKLVHWHWSESVELPLPLGRLSMKRTVGQGMSVARLPAELVIRFRRGGEKIRLPGRTHRHALRNLLQENDVLPWCRDLMPLVFAEKTLIAVGDLYWSAEFAAQPGEPAVQIGWEGGVEWRAVKREVERS